MSPKRYTNAQNVIYDFILLERSDLMGDKGGKKDKEKGQKQNDEKKKQNTKDKINKQPKRKP
jgi:hypothetical protein